MHCSAALSATPKCLLSLWKTSIFDADLRNLAGTDADLLRKQPHKPYRCPFLPVSERFFVRVSVPGAQSGSFLGYRAPLLGGERGVAQTIHLMRRLIDQALNDPQFIRFAIDLVRMVPAHDEAGEVAAIFAWVQQNIRFTKDPVTKEKLYPPQELLKIRAGDCDDISMLIGALAIADGYPARLVTVSSNPEFPNDFSHVYVEVEVPPGSGAWVPLDAARPGSQFGLAPEMYFRKRAWSLIDDGYSELNGYARIGGLSGYARLGSLGQDDGGDGIDWNQIAQTALVQTPQIIAVAEGQPTSVKLPTGATVATGSPYASFATPYTPGYGVPSTGYSLTGASSSLFSALLPWLLVGAVVLAVAKR